jgi:predicted cobalt transporter CbtA
MTRDLLWRGMLAGILAALLATLFAHAFAEPSIDLAIGVEHAHAAHHAAMPGMDRPKAAPEEDLVSRDTQKSWGLATALALYGAAVGGVFALVFAYGYGRFGALGPRSLSLLLAALAFALLAVVPALKYPQTPPAVGRHETVALRTAAYFAMIALSLGAAVVAARLRSAFANAGRGFDATLLAVGAFALIVGAGQFALPTIDEVPADFPATLLWNFRVASLATQALLWATIGITFGIWAERVLKRAAA